MLAIAGQTAGLNWLTFFDGTLEYPCGNKGQNIFFSKNFFLKVDCKNFHGNAGAGHFR